LTPLDGRPASRRFVSSGATFPPQPAGMNFLVEAARFSRLCRKVTPVEIILLDGRKVFAKTAGPAFVWGNWALVEIEGAVAIKYGMCGRSPLVASPADSARCSTENNSDRPAA
jgi:hypothetical protein